jgi:hypothetical protein
MEMVRHELVSLQNGIEPCCCMCSGKALIDLQIQVMYSGI